MVEVHSEVIGGLVTAGYVHLPDSIAVRSVLGLSQTAERDAREVPIDPNGGLPWAYDVFAEDYVDLTAHAVGLMHGLGATSTKVTRVTMIKKAPGEGRRYWHNDEAPSMPKPDGQPPRELLVLYYLNSTNSGSGCLVVRPGFVSGPHHNEHNAQPMPDEVQVPVALGDVVLMDPRLQHASLENKTWSDRLLIRVWTENVWA